MNVPLLDKLGQVEGEFILDQAIPGYLTIDPTTGAIGADFTGLVHAQGLNLDLGYVSTPADQDRIRWLDVGTTPPLPYGYLYSSKYGLLGVPISVMQMGMLETAAGTNIPVGNDAIVLQLREVIGNHFPPTPTYNVLLISQGQAVTIFTVDAPGNLKTSPMLAAAPDGFADVLNNGFFRYFGIIPVANFPPTTAPQQGDVVDVQLSNGIVWRFLYNPASSASYPWQFIGGAPVIVEITSYAFGQLTTWTPFNGVAWAVPSQLQGQYVVSGGYSGQNAASGAATVRAGVMINFGSGYNAPPIYAGSAQSASFDFNIKVGTRYYLFNTGTTTVAMGYWVNAFPTIVNAWIEILPLNVA